MPSRFAPPEPRRLAGRLFSRRLVGGLRPALNGMPLMLLIPIASFAQSVTTLPTVDVSSTGETTDTGYAGEHSATATKTPTPLRDVPQSVTIVTRDLVEDQSMQSVADVLRYVPGASAAQGEGNRDAVVFRGIGSTGDFFVDGVRDDVQYYRDLYNVERVEVLKGPNAMIFGRGGSGGVLNRVTRQAQWHDVREASLAVGSWNARRATADYGRAIDEDAAFRIAAVYEDSDSYRDFFELRRYGIHPTLALRPNPDTLVRLGYEHFSDQRVADRGIPSFRGRPVQTDPSTFFGNSDESVTWARVDAFDASIDHDFGGGVALRNRTRWANYDKFYQNVFPGAVDAAGAMVSIAGYNNRTDRTNFFNQTDVTYSLSSGSVRHTLLGGAEFGRQSTANFRNTAFFGPAGASTSVLVPLSSPQTRDPVRFAQRATDADNHGTANVAALYVQDQIAFSRNLQAIVGLRYDRFEVDFHNDRTGASTKTRDDLVSPRIGVIYKPSDPVSWYASYSVSYVPRAGDQLSSLNPNNEALDPEEFRNVEVGVKWDVRRNLAATAALYRLERSNVAITDPADVTRSILVDGQRSQGIELGLAGKLTPAWNVMGGYAYQDGEITRTQSASVQQGARLAQLPRHTFSLWNRYDFATAWAAAVGVIARSAMFPSTDNEVTLPGFARVDAALFYELSRDVRLQANVENLFDRRYYVSAHSNDNVMPGSPLAVRISVHARF